MSDEPLQENSHTLNKEEQEKLDKMNKIAMEMRGNFIHQFIRVEMLFDIIITSYFCDDKKKANELGYRLISTKLTSFDTKHTIVSFIVSNSYLELLKQHPTLFEDITELNNLRNVLAHQQLFTIKDVIEKFDGEIITFVKFDVKRQIMKVYPTYISNTYFNEMVANMELVYITLNQIKEEIKKGRQQVQ